MGGARKTIQLLNNNAEVSDKFLPNNVKSGIYVGDDTANRPIAHGLNRIPKIIFIGSDLFTWTILHPNRINKSDTASSFFVTAADDSGFHVGHSASYPNSGNSTGVDYHWVAF